jgi:hypothetical protein
MAVVLDRAQRDAVWRFVVADLPDVGDLGRELNHGDVEAARRLRRRFDEDVRLLDLLGWSKDGDRQSYEIAIPTAQAEVAVCADHGRRRGSDGGAAGSAHWGDVGGGAAICTEILRSLRAADGRPDRGEAHGLYDGPRRPDCG